MAKRDYNLLGADSRRALESGLAGAKWYQSEVPREVMRALLARRDGPATRDTVILFGAMAAFGGGRYPAVAKLVVRAVSGLPMA